MLVYNLIKTNNFSEQYIDLLDIRVFRSAFASIRISAHKLEVETGRYIGIDRQYRICTLCNDGIGDEIHFMLVCKPLMELRKKYIPENYLQCPSSHRLAVLLSCKNVSVVRNIALFIVHANKVRS